MDDVDRLAPGGNSPPSDEELLAQALAEETATMRARATALVESASRAAITDDESAGRAATLAKMIVEHQTTVDGAREARKAPFLKQGRVVDGHYQQMLGPMQVAKQAVLNLIQAYRDKVKAEALRVQREKDEQARKAREEAEKLAAEAQKTGSVDAEIKATEAQAAAETAQRQADLVDTSATVQTGFGVSAGGRKEWTHEIENWGEAARHAAKINAAAIRAAVDDIIRRQIRAGIRTFPGVKIFQQERTVVR